jgi:hypothetical protein
LCSDASDDVTASVHAGQRYRALEELEVFAMTHWRAPFTGGHEATLPSGEIFTVRYDPPEGATAAVCDPERYDELHALLIPEEDRDAQKYGGYSLSISLADIREKADLVP